ncbi:MAG: UbiX family flavin prenyltransferase [Planctomycetota bacterium]
MTRRIVVGVTGASGATYACRVMELLADAGVEMHLAVSTLGRRLLFDELDMKRVDPDALTGGRGELVTLYNENDVGAAIASGSFLHDGMVIVPCSANTLGAIAAGLGDNLVRRAAAVTLKERRRLILGYREMPASHIDVGNMKRLGEAGAIIAPLSPAFYLQPKTIDDLVDFVAGRLVDLLGVEHALNTRWEEHVGGAGLRGTDPRPPAAAGSP